MASEAAGKNTGPQKPKGAEMMNMRERGALFHTSDSFLHVRKFERFFMKSAQTAFQCITENGKSEQTKQTEK
jgi:hypothetical protein